MKNLQPALRESILILTVSLVLGFLSTGVSGKGFFAPPPDTAQRNAPQFISLDEARLLHQSESAMFVDGRHAYDFGLGHIKDAINIPLSEFEVAAVLLGSIPKDKTLVTYCDGAECNSSIELAVKLDSLGFSNVRIFFGGWKEWESAQLPTEP